MSLRFITSAFVLTLFLGSRSVAQIPPNFTVTDTKGRTWNLYDQLDSGRTVVLDFFFKECKPCQTYTPMIESVFKDYGADKGKVVILGISDRDDDSAVIKFKREFKVSYPSCGYEGGGDTVTTLYQNWFSFLGWPTYAVICKDTSITWDVKRSEDLPELRKTIDDCAESTSGINDLNLASEITLTYDRNNKRVRIDLQHHTMIGFTVVDVLGKRTSNIIFENTDNTYSCSTEGLSKGLYLIQVETPNGQFHHKLIID